MIYQQRTFLIKHAWLFLQWGAILNVNIAMAIFCIGVFSGFAYLLDPLFHDFGYYMLVDVSSLKGIWTSMYNIPIIIIVVNNGYLSLIRQSEKYNFNMNYEVETWYQDQLMDFVKFADAYGAYGKRVDRPEDITPALQRAVNANRPAVIEIIVERETDASMGPSIDKIVEFEPLPVEEVVASTT